MMILHFVDAVSFDEDDSHSSLSCSAERDGERDGPPWPDSRADFEVSPTGVFT